MAWLDQTSMLDRLADWIRKLLKNTKFGIGIDEALFSIDPKPLTGGEQGFMLTLPLTPSAVRRETLQKIKTVRPIAPTLVHRFFYAYRKGAALIRVLPSSMVGHFLGAASVFAASQTWILLHRPRLETLAGGYLTFKTGNHMNTSTTGSHAQKPTPLFNVFFHRQCLRIGIAGALALRIKRRYPACIVKFVGMEG